MKRFFETGAFKTEVVAMNEVKLCHFSSEPHVAVRWISFYDSQWHSGWIPEDLWNMMRKEKESSE